jgi:hypothetical protein
MARVVFYECCRIVIFGRKTAIFEISHQDGARLRGSVSEFIAPFLLRISHLSALGYPLQPGQNRGKSSQNNATHHQTLPKKARMISRWHDIEYLAHGTEAQRRAHRTLKDLGILSELAPYDATLVSTVCNDIDIPGSDLDIICYTDDPEKFWVFVESSG